MIRNYFFIPCFLSLFSAFCGARQVKAEFVCSSEISYQWIKQEAQQGGTARVVEATVAAGNTKNPAGEGASKSETATSPAVDDTPLQGPGRQAPSTTRYTTVERAGKDEVEAKSALQIEVSRQKGRASDRCRQDHENFGQCLATKLSVKSSVLNSLSFSARAQLEKALTEECQIQLGTCLSVASTDPMCRETVAAGGKGASAPPAAAEGAKTGDAASTKDTAGAAKGKQPKKK